MSGSTYTERAALQTAGVSVNIATPWDRGAIQAFFTRLSPATRYLRFLHAMREVPDGQLDAMLAFDPAFSAAVLAFHVDSPCEVLGIAQYSATGTPEQCEAAVVVADPWQRKGVGQLLLKELARVARLGGFTHACAEILSENQAALELARRFGGTSRVLHGKPQVRLVNVSLDKIRTPAMPARRPSLPQYSASL
jgi:GNAT superfamily N-acetyltransferase